MAAADFNDDKYELDPVFLNSRRESLIIFMTWVAGLIWAVPFCYLNGYLKGDGTEFSLTLGIPTWLFWGILVPWIVADIFTTWFCFWYMTDDDLGVSPEEAAEAADDKLTEAAE